MIVPRGAKFFPNQSPLLGMTIPTVEGDLRLGYSRKRGGMGLLLPVDPTVPVPSTSRLARKPAVRGVGVSRGFGRYRGLGADGQIGTQPVQNLPAQPIYEDCNPFTLGPAASTACANRNLAKQTAWQIAYGQAQAQYNRAMCEWNGNPASYCEQVYPPGYAGSGSPTTVPITPGAPLSARFQTARGSSPQVGDGWSVLITGPANSPVSVVVSGPNGTSALNYGTTDGSGNFATSGTFTADQVGSYTETWSVGAQRAGSFSFTVSAGAPLSARFQTARGSSPQVGDGWSVLITGPANSPVSVVVSGPNGTSALNYGTTDGSGNFATSGTFTADQVGSYTETWSVGSQRAGSFSFTVSAAQSGGAGAGSSAGGGGSVSGSAGGGAGVGPSGGGTVLGGFDLSSIPTWAWIAAAGVGAVLLFGGHR